MSKRRYVLLKDEGNGPKPCAFFASAAGCRNAAACKFSHGDVPTARSAAASSPLPTTAAAAPAQPHEADNGRAGDATADGGNVSITSSSKSKKKKVRREQEKQQEERELPPPISAATTTATSVSRTPADVLTTPSSLPTPAAAAMVEAAPAPSSVSSAETLLSATKAKKKALREKAVKKAAAAAAQAEAEAARLAALGVMTPAVATVPAHPQATGLPNGTTKTPKAKKPKKKSKDRADSEAAVEANGAGALANGVTAVTPPAPTAPVLATAPPVAAVQPAIAAVAQVANLPTKKRKRKNKASTAKEAEAAATAAAAAAGVQPGSVVALIAQQIAALQQQQALPPRATVPLVTVAPSSATTHAPLAVAPPAKPAPGGTPLKVCAFFNKKKGCQSGALCPYLHQGIERGGFGGTRGHAAKPEPVVASALLETPSSPAPVAPATVPPTSQPAQTSTVASPVAVEAQQEQPPTTCRFYGKPVGCKAGAACPFLHLGPAGASAAAPAPQQNQQQRSVVTPLAVQPQSPSPAPVALTVPAATQPNAVLSPMQSTGVATTSPEVVNASSRGTRKRGRAKSPVSKTDDSRGIGDGGGGGLLADLPVTPFVQPSPKGAKKASKDRGNGDDSSAGVAAVAVPSRIPHPKADPWQALVDRTRAHPQYETAYRFETDSTWITASPCGDACAELPQVVALDCEMCMSEDPVSKVRNGKELVRVSVVEGVDGAPVMDTLVRPVNPVVSWRTSIHGVAPEHLEGVLFTHRHAQAAMARICCQHTVIIGHALHNDLESLKMTHDRVVDTSYLFAREGYPDSTPSLRDVVSAALGKAIQEGTHDSVTDAQCTLDVARFALENGPQAPVPRLEKKRRGREGDRNGAPKRRRRDNRNDDGEGDDDLERRGKGRAQDDDTTLTVHRLPQGTTQDQLLRVMHKKTSVRPIKADPIDFTSAYGKSQVYYESTSQAKAAFAAISTPSGTDSSGRQQKRVYTSTDGKVYIQVRQNGSDMNKGHDPYWGPGLQLSGSSSGGEGVDDDGDGQESDSSSS